jgi:hypothetical protein
MKWIILVLAVFFLFFFFSRIKLAIRFIRDKENDKLELEVRLFYLIHLRWEMPSIKLGSDGDVLLKNKLEIKQVKRQKPAKTVRIKKESWSAWLKRSQAIMAQVPGMLKTVHQFTRKIECHRLDWETIIGTDDASESGILSGTVWGAKYGFVSLLSQMVKLRSKPQINVLTDFSGRHFRTRLNCIVSIRLGDAIFSGLRLAWKMYKAKGGVQHWRKNILYKA